jgi:hypothetical protein
MEGRLSSPTVASSASERRPQTPPFRPVDPKEWVFTTPAPKRTPRSPPPAPSFGAAEPPPPPLADGGGFDNLAAFRAALFAGPFPPPLAGRDDLAALRAALFPDPPPPFAGASGRATPWSFAAPFGPQPR